MTDDGYTLRDWLIGDAKMLEGAYAAGVEPTRAELRVAGHLRQAAARIAELEVAARIAQLETLAKPSLAWRPISETPKDGTPILVAWADLENRLRNNVQIARRVADAINPRQYTADNEAWARLAATLEEAAEAVAALRLYRTEPPHE
jgi:hypothetical protein